MNLPGFNAESSLAPSTDIYRGNNAFGVSGAAKNVSGIVLPAAPKREFCATKYRAIQHHWFPVTLCTPIRVDSSLATLTQFGPRGLDRTFASRGVSPRISAARSLTEFGALQDCRVVTLPFIAEVTTTQSCDDSFPDMSELVVQDHPELHETWIGGILDIPAPYNSGWFWQDGPPLCQCCPGFIKCPDGRCALYRPTDKDPCKIDIF